MAPGWWGEDRNRRLASLKGLGIFHSTIFV
jgi:hypothetical protein